MDNSEYVNFKKEALAYAEYKLGEGDDINDYNKGKVKSLNE